MRFYKPLLTFVFALVFALPGFAQELDSDGPFLSAANNEEDWEDIFDDFPDDFPVEFHLLFHSGYQNTLFQPLNNVLMEQGYSQNVQQNLWTNGGSMQLVLWDVIFEIDGQSAVASPVNNDKFFGVLTTGNTFFNMGYQWEPWSWLRIYPVAGIGSSFLNMTFSRRNVLPDFDTFLNEPGWNGSLNYASVALNLGLGIEWEGILGRVGLRGGYLFHPLAESNWFVVTNPGQEDLRSLPLAGGPAMALNGPYLRFVVGF